MVLLFYFDVLSNFNNHFRIVQIEEAKGESCAELENESETNELEEKCDSREAIEVNDEGEKVDDNVCEANEDTAIDKAPVNHPCHLLKAEKDLLLSCTQNKEFRKRCGNLDWGKIENVFEEKADSDSIFNRKRKRLRSTSKKFLLTKNDLGDSHKNSEKEVTCSTNGSNAEVNDNNSNNELICTTNYSNDEVDLPPMGVIYEENLMADLSVSNVTHFVETLRRVGTLDALEREFVKEYGKQRMLRKKNIDNSSMLKAYRLKFPGFSRDGDTLKRCWNNWKKDSTAYKEFANNLER